MSVMVRSRDTPASDAVELLGANDSIQFWQREVYYYEGRAGEQGAAANRMVTVAAGATAVLPLIANTLSAQVPGLGFDVRLLLLVVPILMFLLWTSAIRLLHEMHLLRVYVQRAEEALKKLTDLQPGLKAYTRWADHGLAHDFSFYVMLVWFFSALILSVGGTLGITLLVVNLVSPDRIGFAVAVLAVAVIVLFFSFVDTSNDVRRIKREFGLEKPPAAVPVMHRWVPVLGLISSGAVVVAGPVAAAALIAAGTERFFVGCVLAAFFVATASVGAVAGWISRDSSEKSVGRRASKALVAIALGASIAAAFCSTAGWLGL